MALSARTQQAAATDPVIRLVPGPSSLILSQESIRFFRGTLLAALLSLPFWIAVLLIVWFLR
jgi:hypothetical protein